MTPPLPGEVLARLSEWATAELGLRFPPDRWNELARGVASAALELGIPDLAGWAEELVGGPVSAEQVLAIANHLTISETYFFRQRDTFTALEREILPARIAERRRQSRTLRLWSAGCASGEEPYSLAILLRQRFPDLRPEQVAIAATDINSRVLARAERGIYTEWSFRDVASPIKAGWFKRLPNGRYEVAAEIRKMVHFTQVNLAAPRYPAEFGEGGDFDVILCRNVLMYFSAEWQEAIVCRFAEALAPEGWLIVGPCDVTAAQSAALQLHGHAPGVFQKASPPRSAAQPSILPAAETAPVRWPGPARAEPAAAPTVPATLPAAVSATPVEMPNAAGLTTTATPGEVASAAAQSHANRGELDHALAACDEAIAADKTNPNYHYLRACILQEQNRASEAAEAFRRVLFLDPRSVMAEFALGALAQRGGRAEQARHHFQVVLRMLGGAHRGEAVPGSEGLTVARLRAVVEQNLAGDAA